ncbi:MAG: hypothetical protein OXH39_24685 [Candidatus Poribacteria bacterium]|nr:hypothetical protein [Candidatus Poribacteria bacterium]
MRRLFYRITLCFIFITLTVCHVPYLVAAPFEIQMFDGQAKIIPPYTLISGKRYRLQAVSTDNKIFSAQWFLAGNLGRITTGDQAILIAVFVGEGGLVCRVNGMEQRIKLSVVPASKIIGSSGGKLHSPAGVEISFSKGALATERKIGIEIVPPPGLPPAAQQLVHVIRISPERLVLKRDAQITFLFGIETKPRLYFWEMFAKKWVPLRGNVNTSQGSVSATINHFGIYSLMAPAPTDLERAERLQIQNVTLSPRVFFAPDRHRLTITYQLNAPDATQAFVTMDIFDLRGKRVRRLLEEAPHYIGSNIAQWDGLTDDGVLVRNGRYFLVIHARMGSQRAAQRKLIVVFK